MQTFPVILLRERDGLIAEIAETIAKSDRERPGGSSYQELATAIVDALGSDIVQLKETITRAVAEYRKD